jgi:hypothetical protein
MLGKDDVRKTLGRSPDTLDAVVMGLSVPVRHAGSRHFVVERPWGT